MRKQTDATLHTTSYGSSAAMTSLEFEYTAEESKPRLEQELIRMWSSITGIPEDRVSVDDNLFAMGGQSLHIVRLMHEINTRFFHLRPDDELAISELFDNASISALARHMILRCAEEQTRERGDGNSAGTSGHGPIAIVGMAGRFPGAPSVEALWECLREGRECVQSFTASQLREAGVSGELLERADYVRRGGILEGCADFDAEYFAMVPRDAAMASPQFRLLLECAEEALQHAGYGARTGDERVGVFIGATHSAYP
ncbi:MAG: beta-ketoacyl synthase N-terminal-like domain-containing protein, partial [Steroidobacteraceae bacterium]